MTPDEVIEFCYQTKTSLSELWSIVYHSHKRSGEIGWSSFDIRTFNSILILLQ